MAKKHHTKRQSSGRKPGTFKEKKLHYKRNAVIYDKLREAAKLAVDNGTSTVEIDNLRFSLLSPDVGHPYVGLAFLRIPGRGIVFCSVSTKDRGSVTSRLPRFEHMDIPKGKMYDMVAAWVSKVETIDTGEDVTDKYMYGY